jgi:hypothetical protein
MTLTGQLKDLVENYFEQNPHMSMNALAMKSGVGATTLRRIRSSSIKGDPAPHTVLGLVSSISKEKRLSVLVKKFDGPIGELLQDTFGPYVEESLSHEYAVDLNHHLKDPTAYFVYKLAANRVGTTAEAVKENYGSLGLKKLGELIELGLIEEKGDKFHATRKEYALDVHVVANHLPQLVSHYKPEEIEKGQNLFYTMSESLNEDGIKKIKEIQKEAIKKIITIMNSPYYEGDIPFFTLDMAETLSMPRPQGELQ